MPDEDLYVAGHMSPPGRDRRVGAASLRVVVLEAADHLPASCDGQVAVYQHLGEVPRPSGGPRRTGPRPVALD
jgi:hypothetical protein